MSSQTQNLSILFVDLVGSTALYDSLGDFEAKKIITPVLDSLMDLIQSNQGTVIKTIGDEIMCTFIQPDHAAQCGVQMQEQLKERALSGESEHPLTVKIGFNTGPVIPEDGDVFGNAVNLAARMVSQAKSKQILTTRETLDQLSIQHRECARFVDKVEVKGIQEEIEIYEILGFEDTMHTTISFGHEQSSSEPQAKLFLRYQNQDYVVDRVQRCVKIGRDQINDISCADAGVSRLHCKVELSKNEFKLIDNSTNGTYIQPAEGDVIHCRRSESVLGLQGSIRLGKALDADQTHVIEYRLEK